MPKKNYWIGLASILCVVLLVGIWLTTRSSSPTTSYRIGAILPLTGPGAPFGESSRNALLIAADEINAIPGGPRVELSIEDGMTDPRASVTAFTRLHNAEGTRLFITTVSSVSLALAPLADQEKCLLFANASHPQVTEGRQCVLRYSNTAPDEARILIAFISAHEPAWPRIYVIALNDDYGRAYVQELRSAGARDARLQFLGEEFYDRAATDFRTVATKAIATAPDVVLLIGFGRSMGLCLRQLRELGYNGPFVASVGFILTSDAVTAAGEAVRGGYFLNFAFVSEAGARSFRDRYMTRYGADPTPNAVIDYGTLRLLAQGLREVGGDPATLASYLRGLGTTQLPTGEVAISARGDIPAPVRVVPVPATGSISLWGD